MRILLSVLLITFFISSYGQDWKGQQGARSAPAIGIIKGKVMDQQSNEPIEYATIALLSKKDQTLVTGGVTNAKGRFLLNEIKYGEYLVRIEFLGYENRMIEDISISPKGSTELNLGTILLSPANNILSEVEVTAEKPLITNSIDRKVYNVEKDIISMGGNVTDALQNIPSVDVDIDGAVSLRGNGNVTILIDGKPSGLTGGSKEAVLDQLPASSIERIEVITNPSAKFDPEGTAGIINVVLKKNALEGFNGNVSLSYGTYDKYNVGSLLNYRVGKWNVFGNYSFRDGPREGFGTTVRTNFFEDENQILDQSSESLRGRKSHTVKTGVDFYADSKNFISSSFSYSISDNINTSDVLTNQYFEPISISELSRRLTDGSGDRTGYDANLYYRRDLTNPQHNLILDFTYSDSENDGRDLFGESALNEDLTFLEEIEQQKTENFDTNNSLNLKADYTWPISKDSKLEAGIQSQLKETQNDFYSETQNELGIFIVDSALVNDFNYNEDIFSAYSTYANKIGKFGYQLGLRAEQVLTESKVQQIDDVFNNDYFSLFPSVNLGYDIAENTQILMSYSRRINRPRSRQLNPFTNFSDENNIRRGNPFLLPEYINSYEIGASQDYEKVSLQAAIFYKDVNDLIRRFSTIDGEGVRTLSYVNFAGSETIGTELSINYSPTKAFNINLSGDYSKNTIEPGDSEEIQEAQLDTESERFSAKMRAGLRLPKDVSVQISGRYRAPFDIPQGKIQAFYSMDFGASKQLWDKKATIGFRMSDLFNTFRFELDLVDPNYIQHSERDFESQVAYLTFNYRFGKLQKSKRKQSRGGREEGEFDGGDVE